MIVNASPLIVFGKLNRLNLLKRIFGKIVMSEAVYSEVISDGVKIGAEDALLVKKCVETNMFSVKKINANEKSRVETLIEIYKIDRGEAETIVLALQENEKSILVDDSDARKVARLHSLRPLGSLRVLLLAYRENLLNEQEVKQVLAEMVAFKFRISGFVVSKFLTILEKIKK